MGTRRKVEARRATKRRCEFAVGNTKGDRNGGAQFACQHEYYGAGGNRMIRLTLRLTSGGDAMGGKQLRDYEQMGTPNGEVVLNAE